MVSARVRWVAIGLVLAATIIVPFLLFGDALEAAVVQWLETGPSMAAIVAVVVVVLASDVLLPVPSSIVATAAGALLGFGLGTAANTVGLMLGAGVGYGIGAAGRGAAERVVGAAELRSAQALFERRGDIVVATLRPIPVLAELSVVFAGVTAMPRGKFALYTGLANLGIGAAYAGLGAWAVEADSMLVAVAASLALPGVAMLIGRQLSRADGPAA